MDVRVSWGSCGNERRLEVLVSFLPDDWWQLVQANGALNGLRKDRSLETLLRTLLLHLGCLYSLREKQSGPAKRIWPIYLM